METVCIDGSIGEGGGQVLRTSLTLACITGKRLHIENIRASRPNPGLAKQHLACVEAARAVCAAECTGGALRSMTLDFAPGHIQAGGYHFDVGSAGSASLVIQTILPVLFCADRSSVVTVTGGTHNPWAPPFDFLEMSFVPAIASAGFKTDCQLRRYGFFPAGGGEIVFNVQPLRAENTRPIDLCEPVSERKILAKIYTARLPVQIAQKQAKLLLGSELGIEKAEHINVTNSDGAGNCVVICLCGENRTAVFTGFGAKGKPSERVIGEAVSETRDFLSSGAAIDHHLADQLLIYMAMQKSGRLTTNRLSNHLTTNMEVIKRFLSVDFALTKRGEAFEICCLAL